MASILSKYQCVKLWTSSISLFSQCRSKAAHVSSSSPITETTCAGIGWSNSCHRLVYRRTHTAHHSYGVQVHYNHHYRSQAAYHHGSWQVCEWVMLSFPRATIVCHVTHFKIAYPMTCSYLCKTQGTRIMILPITTRLTYTVLVQISFFTGIPFQPAYQNIRKEQSCKSRQTLWNRSICYIGIL